MEIRGTFRRLFTPAYKPPGASNKMRKRCAAALEPLLWPLAFINFVPVSSTLIKASETVGILPPLFGVFALTRILTLEPGDSRSWRKAMYYLMVANGLVPLTPLANYLPAEPFIDFAQKTGLTEFVSTYLVSVPPPAIFPEMFLSYVGIPLLLAAAGLARYIWGGNHA